MAWRCLLEIFITLRGPFICMLGSGNHNFHLCSWPSTQTTNTGQARKRQHLNGQKTITSNMPLIKSIKLFLTESKSIMFNAVFFQAVIMQSISFTTDYLEKVLMGQILHDILDYRNYTVQINAISGYALVFYEVGGIVGSSLSGKAVDLIKKHKMVMVFCMVLNVLSVIGLIVGRHFYSVITVMVCNTILGFSLCLCDIPIYDIILQQTHPKNPAFVILLFVGESKILVIIFGLAGRFFL